MTNDSISSPRFQLDGAAKMGQPRDDADERLFDGWFDPIESAVRDRVRSFIEELIESELETVLALPRYGRRAKDSDRGATAAGVVGHRHGRRTRRLTGTFGQTEIAVPRARLMQPDGGTREWKSAALRAYQSRTLAAEALIAGAYLAGVNTRRVRRALAALFSGAVGKDIVSRTLRMVKGGEGRLGRLELSFARRRADRAADPRRHGRARAARPQGDRDLAAGRHRRARRRAKGAARG